MKVGTDGVLLGAWAHGGRRILDIGSGTGLIALMMAQRFPESLVDGVEIDGGAARQAAENVAISPFADRVSIHEVALQQFVPQKAAESLFDAIVTNPPFFDSGRGLSAPDAARRMARQRDSLPFGDIFVFARRWLKESGEVSAIVPAEQAEAFMESAAMAGFFLARVCEVRTVVRKKPKRQLLAFSKTRPEGLERTTITLMDNGQRSSEYAQLTREFYVG